MKIQSLFLSFCISILIALSTACKPEESDGRIEISFTIENPAETQSKFEANYTDARSILISAVPEGVTSVNNTAIPIIYHNRQFLDLDDYSVSFILNRGATVRLAQHVFDNELDEASLSVQAPIAVLTGLSEPINITGFATEIRVPVALVEGPAILSVAPADKTTGISTDTHLAVTFSKPMDASSFSLNSTSATCTGSIQISENSFATCQQIAANPVFSSDKASVTFDIMGNLSNSTTYQVKIAKEVTDTSGNCMTTDFLTQAGFSTEASALSSSKSLSEFIFEAAYNSALDDNVVATIDESNHTISGSLPYFSSSSALVASFTSSGNHVKIGSTTQASGTTANDFSSSLTYAVTAADGTNQDYTVNITPGSAAQQAYIKAANAEASDNLGNWIFLENNTLVVGVPYEDSSQTTVTNGTTASSDNASAYSGAVYLYQRSGSSWVQQAYFKAVNNDANDNFGFRASLSGDTLAVGAYNEDANVTAITNGPNASSDDTLANSGAAYVYRQSAGSWAQEAYIKADNAETNDNFGQVVSISGDTLAVTARFEDSNQTTITNGTSASSNNGSIDSGAVYVYQRSGSTWAQQAYIKAYNNTANDIFGSSISLDGDTLAVGAYHEDSNQATITNGTTASSDNSSIDSGAVYIYRRTGSTWVQEAYIKAVNNSGNDSFGGMVALSGDTLAVGAAYEDSNQTGITNGPTASSDDSLSNSGAVYIYKRTGTNWVQEAYIKAPNADNAEFFGVSLSLSDNLLVVGTNYEDSNQTSITEGATASSDNSSLSSGAAYVFKRTNDTWTQVAYVKSTNAESNDYFGASVAVSGNTVAVGAWGESSSQTTITNGSTASSDNSAGSSGAVYVYR